MSDADSSEKPPRQSSNLKRGWIIATIVMSVIGLIASATGIVSFAYGKSLPDFLQIGPHGTNGNVPTIVVTAVVKNVTQTCTSKFDKQTTSTFALNSNEVIGLLDHKQDAQAAFASSVYHDYLKKGVIGDTAGHVEIFAGAPTGSDIGSAIALAQSIVPVLQSAGFVFTTESVAYQTLSVLGRPSGTIELVVDLNSTVCTEGS